VLGADLDGALPDPGVIEVPAEQHHLRTTGQPGPGAARHQVLAEQDQRRPAPGPPGARDVVRDIDLDAAGSGQPQQVIEKQRVGRDQQGAAVAHGCSGPSGAAGRRTGRRCLRPGRREPAEEQVVDCPRACGQQMTPAGGVAGVIWGARLVGG